MLGKGMDNRGGMAPGQQIDLVSSMLGLETAMQPPKPERGYRVASPEEAARYGATAGQVGPDGRFYPSTPAASTKSGEAGILRQRNEATELIGQAVGDVLDADPTLSREEAMARVARDPIYGPQFQILEIDPADVVRNQIPAPSAIQEQGNGGLWQRLFGGGDQSAQQPAPAPNPAPATSAPPPPPSGFTEDF
jgi:hypothetical protein